MKHYSPFIFIFCNIIFLQSISAQKQGLKIKGTIRNKGGIGIANVQVSVVKDIPLQPMGASPYYGELITLTNSTGNFAFGIPVNNNTTTYKKTGNTYAKINHNRLSFFTDKKAPVLIRAFTLSGKLITTVYNQVLNQGTYSIDLSISLKSQQLYVLHIKIGSTSYTLNYIPNVHSYSPMQSVSLSSVNAQTAYEQKGSIDTVLIIKNGYWAKRIPIESYEIDMGVIKLDSIILECEGCDKEPPLIGQAKYQTINVNGEDRDYMIYVPSGYNKTTKNSLFICLHGRGATGESDRRDTWTPSLEPTFGDTAIFIYPDARYDIPDYERIWRIQTNQGNYELLDELVKYSLKNYCIDTKRIYMIGFSLGAKMALGVWCVRGGSLFRVVTPASEVASFAFNCTERHDCTLGDCTTPSPIFISSAKENVANGKEYYRAIAIRDSAMMINGCTKDIEETIDEEEWGYPDFEYRVYRKNGCEKYPVMWSINDANHWFELPQSCALRYFNEQIIPLIKNSYQ